MQFRSRLILGAVLLFSVTSLAVANGAPVKRLDQGSGTCRILTDPIKFQGYTVFRNSCKTCHYKGNDKNAPFLYAEAKSMKAWDTVFYKRYPACAQNGSWDNISEDDLLALNDFLYSNAFDAYDPNDAQNCG